jgi:hypothetical protein
VGGGVLPVMMIMFGNTLEAFVRFELFTNGSCTNTDLDQPFSPMPALETYGWSMCVAGVVVWVDAYIFVRLGAGLRMRTVTIFFKY